MNHQVFEITGYYFVEVGEHFFRACSRCQGVGKHLFDGITSVCYRCRGGQIDPAAEAMTLKEAEKNAKTRAASRRRREAKREAERLAICAERDGRVAEFTSNYPDEAALLVEALENGRGGFLLQLAEQLHNAAGRDLSARQIEALTRIVTERAAAEVNLVPIPEGRMEVIGKIISTKYVPDAYSFTGETLKMLVEDARGFRVYGTVPSKMVDDLLNKFQVFEGLEESPTFTDFCKGFEVTFSAGLTRSQDDAGFGFFKRPTKPALI